MSFNNEIKFEKFAGTSEEEDNEDDKEQQQKQPKNEQVFIRSSNLQQQSNNHHQNYFHLLTCQNSKTITVTFSLILAFAVLMLLLVVLILGVMLAFIVKCDESRLIGHSAESSRELEQSFSDFVDSWNKNELERAEDYMAQKIKWIPYEQIDKDLLQPFEPAGVERHGSSGNVLIFVARTIHQNATLVGKYCAVCKKMYFGYAGREYNTRNFEVLSYPSGTLNWMSANVSTVPSKEVLLLAGKAPVTGGGTYVCRIKQDIQLLVGKYVDGSGVCVGAWKNKEYQQETFEMLVVNEMGKLLAVQQ